MSRDDGRVIDLLDTTPRLPPAVEPASGAAYVRLAVFVLAVFAFLAAVSLLPTWVATPLMRWLSVCATAGCLFGISKFLRVVWQFRSDDKVPIGLAILMGAFWMWRLANVLNGRDPEIYVIRGLRIRLVGTPMRWLGYPTGEAIAWTLCAVLLALAVLWLILSVRDYAREQNRAAAMVVAAASVALSGIVWLIVN